MKMLSMADVQQRTIDILIKIDEICRKENLRYCLAYGSLIGAIRHKGFIPWDDDLDIMMPRPDYDKLVEYFNIHQSELKPFELFHPEYNKDYPYMISRISDSRYVLDVDNEDNYGMGLFVDVYPLDGVGKTVEEYTALKSKSNRFVSMCFLSTRQKIKRENTKSFLKFLLKYPAFLVAKVLGKGFFMKHINNIQAHCDYDGSKYIGCIVWGSDDGLRGIFPKEWFDEYIDIEFEGKTFKAPKEYDRILSHVYGNYMELPPEEDRIAHHYYDAYLK